MKLYIGWNYKREQNNVVFKQKITIAKNVTLTPTFCVGSQIVNVYNACYSDALLRFSEKRFMTSNQKFIISMKIVLEIFVIFQNTWNLLPKCYLIISNRSVRVYANL